MVTFATTNHTSTYKVRLKTLEPAKGQLTTTIDDVKQFSKNIEDKEHKPDVDHNAINVGIQI